MQMLIQSHLWLVSACLLYSELAQTNLWILIFAISKVSIATNNNIFKKLAFHIWPNYSKFAACWVASVMLHYKKQTDTTQVTQATSQYSPTLASKHQGIPAIWQLFMWEQHYIKMQGDFWTTNKSHDELVNRSKEEKKKNSMDKSFIIDDSSTSRKGSDPIHNQQHF